MFIVSLNKASFKKYLNVLVSRFDLDKTQRSYPAHDRSFRPMGLLGPAKFIYQERTCDLRARPLLLLNEQPLEPQGRKGCHINEGGLSRVAPVCHIEL